MAHALTTKTGNERNKAPPAQPSAQILGFSRGRGGDIVSYDTHPDAPTSAEYQPFRQAYDFLNTAIFSGSLLPVLITPQRHHNERP